MIEWLEFLAFPFTLGYSFVFFRLLGTFLPFRRSRVVTAAGFLACGILSDCIIYSNDLDNLLGTLLFFGVYVVIFHRGKLMEKLSVLLVFYPALISVNYLTMDIGKRTYYGITGASYEETLESAELMLISTAIHTISLLLRLLFWIGAWILLRKFLGKITSRLNIRMWLIVDMLMLASFVAVFTIILFMPEDTVIVYPICGASIFSSFGCMYLASYICESIQNAYRIQELETQRNYYKDRIRDEERVRSIYHDLKNHLLIWQSESGEGNEVMQSARKLQSRIEGYEKYWHTGNEVLDIIIRDKAKLASEMQIDFNAVIAFEDGSFLETLDISTIFGNALDNAIEASEKLPEDQRLITVKAGRVRDMLAVLVENTVSSDMVITEKTTKKDNFLHGFGLSNIRRAVEQYGGQCTVGTKDGMFALKIMIPMP